jgi:AcrR family transcriptional regulator
MIMKEPIKKRSAELDRRISRRKEIIKNAAIREFIENGIERTKISDIALRAEIGEATVYRYFSTKPQLVAECAIKLWRVVMTKLILQIHGKKKKSPDGLSKIREILLMFASLYEKHPELLRMLNQLDNYASQGKLSQEMAQQFTKEVVTTQFVLLEIMQEGQRDGSIRSDFDAAQFCVAATHSIVALSQKMLFRSELEKAGFTYSFGPQIQNLVDMQLYFIQNRSE